MTDQIPVEEFRGAFLACLEEAFEHVHGYFLDKGTSLFETLDTVTAEEASRSASPRVATLAAQVEHTAFYIDVLLKAVAAGGPEKAEPADWEGSWSRTSVAEEEWDTLRQNLRDTYTRFVELAKSYLVWNASIVGGAIAVVAHSAYHLGEIRQALGVIRA